MTHGIATKVIVEPVDGRLVDVTFFSGSYPNGAKARYPRDEVLEWLRRWLVDGEEQKP